MASQEGSPQGPESHEAWANTTKGLLGGAASVTSELFEALKGTDALTAHKESPKLGTNGRPRNVDKGPHHAKIIDAKLEVTKAALNSVDGSCQRCTQILGQLGHERQAKWAALKVVEWRLALRERRPKSELFKDHLQDALEVEKKVLEDSRKILVDRSAEMRVAVEDCEANKAALQRYVRFMICLGDPNPPQAKPNEASAPNSPAGASPEGEQSGEAAGEGGAEGSSALKKPAVPSDLEGLIQRAPPLHDMSLRQYFRGEKLIQSQKVVCARANEKTLACFLKRAAENKELKLGLDKQIREMDEATATAEKSISRMKKDIEFFGKVELQPKVDSTSAIVEKLKLAKAELVEDQLRKVVSMRIDDCCRKITPERTCQDPDSMPVAALLDAKGTKGKIPEGRKRPQMARVGSSPAFVNGNIDSAATTFSSMSPAVDSMASTATNMQRPASPAGLSSPLKAAATASLSR